MKPARRRTAFNASLALVAAASVLPATALACSSCGCTLSSDWGAQGHSSGPGWRVDARYDYFVQDQLRTGTGKFDRGSVSFPADQEIQQQTANRNLTVTLDYSASPVWGVSVVVPYFDRYHTTIVDGDTDVSTSHTTSIGDIRVIGRYQGFSPDHSTGVQFGLKFATGDIHNNFIDGPQAGSALDRGLQPGTGTTDLLIGFFNFGALNREWDYFVQAMLQQPLAAREDFKPGTGLNATVGLRYVANEMLTPHIQINTRIEKRESGANADVDNSGATLVYLSPGVTYRLTHSASVYGFVQVPIYQRVNGLQLEPRYSVSAGFNYVF